MNLLRVGSALLAERLDTDLMWFEAGVLTGSSARVLVELGLTGLYLAPDVYLALAEADALEVAERIAGAFAIVRGNDPRRAEVRC